MITEEKLMAYADGELTLEDRALVESALLENGHVQGVLAEEWRLRRSLLALYDPALKEEVPERLTMLLKSAASAPHSVGTDASAPPGRWWRNVTALAAALAFGVLLGHEFATGSRSPAGESRYVADGELNGALDVQLASTQTSSAPIQVGISFIGPEGAPCRSFQTRDVVGLACRENDGWALRLVAPFQESASFEYQKAGSATALVMQSAQELMIGGPMDAVEERKARDSGWATRAR